MIFDFDESTVEGAVSEALEQAGSEASEEQWNKICDAIDNAIPGVIELIARNTMHFWKDEARSAGGWGTKYAPAIKYDMVSGNEAEIYLDESLMDKKSNRPNIMFAKMIEEGVKSWSIKDALLASEKAKTSKDGVKYIVVPFPVSTPRGKTSTKMASHFGGREMTKEMHDLVKGGGRLKSGSITTKKGDDVDVSGLTRYNTRKFHSQYGMFRCVSENSKGWQYPNKAARPIYPSVLDYVNKEINNVIKKFCQEVVREYTAR